MDPRFDVRKYVRCGGRSHVCIGHWPGRYVAGQQRRLRQLSDCGGDAVATSHSCAPGMSASNGNLPSCDPGVVNPAGADQILGTADDSLAVSGSSGLIDPGDTGAPGLTDVSFDVTGAPRVQGASMDSLREVARAPPAQIAATRRQPQRRRVSGPS